MRCGNVLPRYIVRLPQVQPRGYTEFALLKPDVLLQGMLAQLVLADNGATPSRMNRTGAARTYSLYQSWGYFQRRMLLRRAAAAEEPSRSPGEAMTEGSGEWGDTEKPSSSYGETSAVWRCPLRPSRGFLKPVKDLGVWQDPDHFRLCRT